MAIDTTSVENLITELRQQHNKDSITPETLGHILDRILAAIRDVDNKPVLIPHVPMFRFDAEKQALFITY